MNIEDIEIGFMTDFTNPGSAQSGNYFYSIALQRAKVIVSQNKKDLVAVLSSWIKGRLDHFAMLGVYIAKDLKLTELLEDIIDFRKAMDNDSVFYADDKLQVDSTIEVLRDALNEIT
jgi:hypothetical protein